MTDLRWVLLGLGFLVILGVYLWGRGLPQSLRSRLASLKAQTRRPDQSEAGRVEPAVEFDNSSDERSDESADESVSPDDVPPSENPADAGDEEFADEPLPERIVTLRFLPREGELPCDRVLLALRSAGLRHGRFGIFHRHADEFSRETLFSVASLTEPGSFDLARAAETRIPGMSFFMVLPGSGDPIERFDSMVSIARELARELNGELRDEKGSSWSIQRERYVREEIIKYRHALERSPRPV